MTRRKDKEEPVVYFDFDSYAAPLGGARGTAKVAGIARPKRDKVRIEGNCDELGTTEYNLALGEERAPRGQETISCTLAFQTRLATVSYGSQRPKDPVMTTTPAPRTAATTLMRGPGRSYCDHARFAVRGAVDPAGAGVVGTALAVGVVCAVGLFSLGNASAVARVAVTRQLALTDDAAAMSAFLYQKGSSPSTS